MGSKKSDPAPAPPPAPVKKEPFDQRVDLAKRAEQSKKAETWVAKADEQEDEKKKGGGATTTSTGLSIG